MPKNPLKGFARRKSSGNVLDIQPEQPSEQPAPSSFRVLERPNRTAQNTSDGRRLSSGRPLSAIPFYQPKGKSTEDLGRSTNRGSGTTTLSGSSGYYDTSSSSARYSSSSTLPSSLDQEHDAAQDELFPAKPTQLQQAQHALQAYHAQHEQASATAGAHNPNPSFSSRASRAMSFGLRSKRPESRPESQVIMTQEPIEQVPALPDLPDNAAIRNRATTVSSYASTAVPPRLEGNLGTAEFGSDFGNMFEGLGESKKETQMPLPPPPRALGGYLRSDSEPLFQHRSTQRQAATPSPEPETQRNHRPQQLAPTKRYSWQSRTSHDGLISPALESDMASPRSSEFSQDTIKAPTGFSRFRPGYQPVPIRGPSPSPAADQTDFPSSSPSYYGRSPVRHITESSDEDSPQQGQGQVSSRTEPKALASSMQLPPQQRAGQSMPPVARHPAVAMVKDDMSSNGSADGHSSLGMGSQNTTPKATTLQPQIADEPLFDVSPAGPASRAIHPLNPPRPAPHSSSSSPKRMTRAQFDMQRAAPEGLKSDSSDSEDGYDDGDEDERQAELARQRRKQEANMSVYRQQMMKVSGGTPSDLPSPGLRPGMDRASLSAPALQHGALPEGADEEDDDVPLGILQAHGFPNRSRPPTQYGSGSAPATPGSQVGSVMGDGMGGALPPFARRLPQLPPDPYFGAGLVNPMNRESLAFAGNSTGSAYGGSAPAVQPVHAGGLVGVIAGEERARAARRGSPNTANGGYGPMPLPNNMQMQMPGMPRSNSMMSMMQGQMGGQVMNPMQMDNQQQMLQMMQMQQQMMQHIIQLQAGQQPSFPLQPSPSQQSMGNGFLSPNVPQRPMSSVIQGSGRSMSMMQAPPQWGDGAAHGRSNTMGSTAKPMGYAGSVYNYNLSAPAPGYTPSIAPSERSNVGMPSRYRPVSTMEANGANSRTQTMTSNMDAYTRQNGSSPSLLGVAPPAPKSTIRVIDKPKGTPKSPPPRNSADEEDDDEGWAAMRKKRAERKMKSSSQQKEPALSDLYANME